MKSFTPRYRNWLWIIMVSYGIVAITYMLATPVFEASDEYKHYPVVQHIQAQGRLPILAPENPGLWLQEGAQPPLYYLIMAGLTAWIDTSDLPDIHQVNKHAFVGNPNQIGNKNLIIHHPDQEGFPGQGTVLAVYVIRLASIFLGMGTIWLAARLGGTLFSPAVGLLAAALTAFNPMFLFVSAAVNNDSLAIFLGHLGLYWLVRLWQEAPEPRAAWTAYARLGLVLGLGILTKLSLGGLLALTGIALAWLAWRRGQWRLLFGGGMIVLATAVLVTGWWFVRNIQVYQDPTGLNAFIAVQGIRDDPMTWSDWLIEFGTFFRTYWGLFGGVNVAAPQPFYWVYNIFFLVGIAGFVKQIRQAKTLAGRGTWLIIAWTCILLILLIRWNIISPAFQGRLIFPALGGINAIWAVGLLAWVRDTRQPQAVAIIATLSLVTAAILPWQTIRPAYAFPEALAGVPPTAQIEPITFVTGDGIIQLTGIDMPPQQQTTPGGRQPVAITLYWQLAAPVTADYLSSLHLIGRGHESVGQVNRYPAMGQILTSEWQVGDIWRDEYNIYVQDTAVAPSQLRVAVSLYDKEAGQPVPVVGPDGAPIPFLLVGNTVRLAANESKATATPAVQLDVAFGEGMTLAGYTWVAETAVPGQDAPLTLYWQATGTPSRDYTVFVHLLDTAGAQLAGADAPPVNGDYPTSLWQSEDWIDDSRLLPLPPDLAPGEYRIIVGWYDPNSGVRVPRLDGNGDAAEFTVEITRP
jgi:4-amino-4-deoxy-L-arabinose transferase-like glycosyltransferase